METPIEQPLEEDTDYVPLSIKVIVIWFYLLGMTYLIGSISFQPTGIAIDAVKLVISVVVWGVARGLSYRTNSSRVIAIALAGLWFLPYLYLAWQVLYKGLGFHIKVFGNINTSDSAKVWFFAISTVMALMQIYTIVALLQPQTRRLFSKTRVRISETSEKEA